MMYRLTINSEEFKDVNKYDDYMNFMHNIISYIRIRGCFIKHYRLTDTIGTATIVFNPRYANIDNIKKEISEISWSTEPIEFIFEELKFDPTKKIRRNKREE